VESVGVGIGIAHQYSESLQPGHPRFDSQWEQDFSLLLNIEIGLGVHPAFCPIGTSGDDWIFWVQSVDQWWAFVNMIINLQQVQ
jgi:hypothetical protein